MSGIKSLFTAIKTLAIVGERSVEGSSVVTYGGRKNQIKTVADCVNKVLMKMREDQWISGKPIPKMTPRQVKKEIYYHLHYYNKQRNGQPKPLPVATYRAAQRFRLQVPRSLVPYQFRR